MNNTSGVIDPHQRIGHPIGCCHRDPSARFPSRRSADLRCLEGRQETALDALPRQASVERARRRSILTVARGPSGDVDVRPMVPQPDLSVPGDTEQHRRNRVGGCFRRPIAATWLADDSVAWCDSPAIDWFSLNQAVCSNRRRVCDSRPRYSPISATAFAAVHRALVGSDQPCRGFIVTVCNRSRATSARSAVPTAFRSCPP